jgi:hypothetical protein
MFTLLALSASLGALQVSNRTQTFVDDALVASMAGGLTRTMNVPAFDTVVLQAALLPAAPWEVGFVVETLGTSVVKDPASGTVRMYYSLRWAAQNAEGVPVTHVHPAPHMFLFAVAESVDGVTFTKPALAGKPFVSNLTSPAINVSRSNILCMDECIDVVWISENGPSPHRYWGAAESSHPLGLKIWHSADGIEWSIRGVVPVPALRGMSGLDSMASVFWDPGCQCMAAFDRLWKHHSAGDYKGGYRMVRRIDVRLSGAEHGNVTKQGIVLQADAIDLATHKSVVADIPPVGYYGATAWVKDYGSGQRRYFMLGMRYWHWQGGNARPGEGGEPATYDIPLLTSNDGFNYSYLGGRQPFARPSRDSEIGSRRLWMTPPLALGDEELYYLTRGNMNEDGEVANSTDGSACHRRGADCVYRSEVAVGRLRRDGEVSLDSPYGIAAATLTTHPLVYTGTELELNVDASGGGSVTVEMRSLSGAALTGSSAPITHSSVRAKVSWGADEHGVAQHAGHEVVLVFTMEEAKLFSFRFAR